MPRSPLIENVKEISVKKTNISNLKENIPGNIIFPRELNLFLRNRIQVNKFNVFTIIDTKKCAGVTRLNHTK